VHKRSCSPEPICREGSSPFIQREKKGRRNETGDHSLPFVKSSAWERPARGSPPPQLVFEDWLRSRQDLTYYAEKHQRYPVFIVAARGGGIYAASQEAIFLSRMQDQCANFSQHIFAISGVSGGSVGAALFSSLARQFARNRPWEPCHFGDPELGVLESRAKAFLETDLLESVRGLRLKRRRRTNGPASTNGAWLP
jgi:hypothetical protein